MVSYLYKSDQIKTSKTGMSLYFQYYIFKRFRGFLDKLRESFRCFETQLRHDENLWGF